MDVNGDNGGAGGVGGDDIVEEEDGFLSNLPPPTGTLSPLSLSLIPPLSLDTTRELPPSTGIRWLYW